MNEAAADYSFNQSPRSVLRADLLPDRLAQGQLPGRVHGRADLLGDVHQGQGALLRRPLRGDGDRGAAARREHVGARLQGRRRQRSASASTRSRTWATRRSRRSSRPARRAARSRRSGTSASAWTASGEQEGHRVPRQVRSPGLADRHAHGADARGARRRRRRRAQKPSRTPSAARDLLRPRRRRRRSRPRAPDLPVPAAARRVDQPSSLRLEKETLGTVPLRPPAQGGARGASGAGRLAARRPGLERRRLGDRRRDHRRGEEGPHQQGDP